MNYLYKNGAIIFPGDIAIWEDSETRVAYRGVIALERKSRESESTYSDLGVFLKLPDHQDIICVQSLKDGMRLPIMIDTLTPVVSNRSIPHYLTGEEIETGDIVDVDVDGLSWVRVIHGKSDEESWEPGNKIFFEFESIDREEAPLFFSYTDRNDKFISDAMQELTLVYPMKSVKMKT